MKRLIAVLAGAVLVGSILTTPSATAAARQRVEELKYKMPAQGAYTPIVHAWAFDCMEGEGCVPILLRWKERYISIEIEDANGTPVYARLLDQSGKLVADVYGKTKEPIRVPGWAFMLHIVAGVSPSLQPSAPTSGVVVVRYSR